MSADVWRCLQVFLDFLLWFGTCTLPCWIRWTCPDISRSRIPARQRVQRARAILFTDMKIHGFSPLTSMNKLDDQDSKKNTLRAPWNPAPPGHSLDSLAFPELVEAMGFCILIAFRSLMTSATLISTVSNLMAGLSKIKEDEPLGPWEENGGKCFFLK